jgi:tRNA modification GTPase
MSVFAAVMTGKGTGAIATIQVYGDSAKSVIEKIFKPPVELKVGKIHIGTITDGNQTIDQATIGCEGPDTFAVNCHGNPLIAEQIMQLLQKHKVKLLTAKQMIAMTFTGNNTIALEAKLMLPKVKTIEGTNIILNQIDSGLTIAADNWLKMPLNQIFSEAQKITNASEIAKFIIFGCKIVLAGPPNSGKSTLFNQLLGKEKAIVTNIKGTTRDWISGEFKIGPLAIELIDTAGLDERLNDDIDKSAQQASFDIINHSDLILFVMDANVSKQNGMIKTLSGKKIITVLNKSDLPCRLTTDNLPNTIKTSALSGNGLDVLADKIIEVSGVKDLDANQAVCFTARQKQLLMNLLNAKTKESANLIITELLSGKVNV